MSRKPKIDDRALISDPGARGLCGNISVMTRTRWEADERIGWPAVVAIIRGRRFYRLRDVHALLDRLIALTTSGVSVTVPVPNNPNPKRSKKTQPVGGVVSG